VRDVACAIIVKIIVGRSIKTNENTITLKGFDWIPKETKLATINNAKIKKDVKIAKNQFIPETTHRIKKAEKRSTPKAKPIVLLPNVVHSDAL